MGRSRAARPRTFWKRHILRQRPTPASRHDAGLSAKVTAIAYTAVAHAAKSDRTHPAHSFDAIAVGKPQSAMIAWNRAAELNVDTFRDRFIGPFTSDHAVILLRNATQATASADSHADLREAGATLTKAISRIGLDRWPRFVHDAADRVDGDGANSRRYVATNPLRWNAQPSVGDGQCVALVQAAAYAPNTAQWRAGELVKGISNCPPGPLSRFSIPTGIMAITPTVRVTQRSIWGRIQRAFVSSISGSSEGTSRLIKFTPRRTA